MNVTFVHVTTQEGFEKEKIYTTNLIRDTITKKANIALGGVGNNILPHSFFDSTK